jgi:UDP-GlcNAc3NAcA epimerase
MLAAIEEVLLSEKPDMVLVYGDTNSTLAGALAAVKLHIKVAHVEAGLRSFNRAMPEEINRIATDAISDLLFCPSQSSKNQLLKEGIVADKVHFVGDVMFDAVKFYAGQANGRYDVSEFKKKEKPIVAMTLHRAENTDNPTRLQSIFTALSELSKVYSIIFPVHPRTAQIIKSYDTGEIKLVPPVGYLEMLSLVQQSGLVITDSGGLQKEAAFLGRPCLTLRDETEWTELLEAGCNRLAGADSQKILAFANELVGQDVCLPEHYYGVGDAGQKIAEKLF